MKITQLSQTQLETKSPDIAENTCSDSSQVSTGVFPIDDKEK